MIKYLRESPYPNTVNLIVVKPIGTQYRTLIKTINHGVYNAVMNVVDKGWSIAFYPWVQDTVYGKLENPEYFNNISKEIYGDNAISIEVFADAINDFLNKVDNGTKIWCVTLHNSVTPIIHATKSIPYLKKYRLTDKHWAIKRRPNKPRRVYSLVYANDEYM